MKRPVLVLTIMLLLFPLTSRAEPQGMPGTILVFASSEAGRQVLMTPDDFTRRLSAFDRAGRRKTARDVTDATFLEFLGKNVLDWTDAEKNKVEKAFRSVQARVEELSLSLPERVIMIKTTGKEEGDTPYSRDGAIIFPRSLVAADDLTLQKIIAHMLFHIIVRGDPDLRERMYGTIGFKKCGEVQLPSTLRTRKITLPDAPVNDHCIQVKIAGRQRWVIPIVYTATQKYDARSGGDYFKYMLFRFLAVDPRGEQPVVQYDKQKPQLFDTGQVSGFFEQVGTNTELIIHPEEILASNFSMLALRRENAPSPEVMARIRQAIAKP